MDRPCASGAARGFNEQTLRQRGIVTVRQGKGKKDRIVPLSEKILGLLREYYAACRPRTWLFEGQKPNTQYNERSLARILKQALAKTPHH